MSVSMLAVRVFVRMGMRWFKNVQLFLPAVRMNVLLRMGVSRLRLCLQYWLAAPLRAGLALFRAGLLPRFAAH
jgi:hypothetical protein